MYLTRRGTLHYIKILIGFGTVEYCNLLLGKIASTERKRIEQIFSRAKFYINFKFVPPLSVTFIRGAIIKF